MKTESVHPGHREERTRDEALAPVDDCIRRHDHERIKRSLGWMSPVQYRQSQGTAARSSPRKRPQPLIRGCGVRLELAIRAFAPNIWG